MLVLAAGRPGGVTRALAGSEHAEISFKISALIGRIALAGRETLGVAPLIRAS